MVVVRGREVFDNREQFYWSGKRTERKSM